MIFAVTGSLRKRGAPLQDGAGAFEVVGGVDAERHVVDEHDVDAHAGLERPQLLEPLPHLERRGRQRHIALERRAPIGIEPDVVEERPRPARRGGAREIERPQAPGRQLGADGLDDGRVEPLLLARDHAGERRDVDARVRERLDRGGDGARIDGRQIALNVDDHVMAPLRVEAFQRPRRCARSR